MRLGIKIYIVFLFVYVSILCYRYIYDWNQLLNLSFIYFKIICCIYVIKLFSIERLYYVKRQNELRENNSPKRYK